MRVVKLLVKHQPSKPVQECQALTCQRGYGIVGDVNALPGNPRQVLLVSTSTLAQFNIKPGDLRENLLIDTPIERLSSGTILQVGDCALIRLMFGCEPCAYLEQLQPGLAKKIKGKRGFLGMVVRDGEMKSGDEITVTSHRLAALPESAKGRFAEFVQRIPPGRVVKTTDLLMAMGVAKAYARAIPTFLKTADSQLPVHRIVRANGGLLSEHIAEQAQLLAEEGVQVERHQIAEPRFYWEASQFHDLGDF